MVFYIDYKSLSLFVLLYVNITIYSGYLDTQNKKDRHQACPEVNCIVHPTSILYGDWDYYITGYAFSQPV